MKLRHFALRDHFWLVLVVATGCGWWIDRRVQNEKIGELETRLRVMEIGRHLPIYRYPGDQSPNAPLLSQRPHVSKAP